MSDNQIAINGLSKVYDNGFNALKNINLNIKKGEIFAMLGPNGAGKTTLINIICGIVKPSSGGVTVEEFNQAYKQLVYEFQRGNITDMQFWEKIVDILGIDKKKMPNLKDIWHDSLIPIFI